ncbi:MAG TPA: IPT/TIG domain-containing protein, partial [Candidatus Dormibacteraeota bacterium]|nr:IPT/TIG domain-containing protein [Candidatus Dormibacteraeota bacterium]
GGGTATNRLAATARVIAIHVPNVDGVGSDPWQNYITNVYQIQNDTGYTFFTTLPSNLATVLRSKIDGQPAPAPSISNFSPLSGAAGTVVSINGNNLNFTTNVTFNGLNAAFNIVSSSNVTAIVPSSATTGPLVVKTLGGNATDPSAFTVSANTNADLALKTTLSGVFVQGDPADTISVVVTNMAGAGTTGAVTVSNTLPAGLTATDFSGSGWTTDLNALTATRSDVLAVGATYPALVLTVSVGTNAPASVTNIASVSGGGDLIVTNNSATDVITIGAASAPVATTGSASNVNSTTATLNGTVNPNRQPASAQFEYGLTTNYGSIVSVPGSATGVVAQAVAAPITGLTASTTYHFRLDASNALGSVTGDDQIFTSANLATPDFAVAMTHSGTFTQGDFGRSYVITVTNLGAAASSGTITVTDSLPGGLTATTIGGTGWTTNLATLTCTRSDPLPVGSAYPPITITVNVSQAAPAILTNSVTVSGGGDLNGANNTAIDITTINASAAPAAGILLGWDTSALPGGAGNYGPSLFPPTTNAPNITVGGLTRGLGVSTNSSGAARGWGGNAWTNQSAAAAIGSNQFATFAASANAGYQVSFSAISRFDYRHSATGPTNGLLQYQLGSGPFIDIATLLYPSSTNIGDSLSPIVLTNIPALQNVGAGTNVTFRIVNWGGSSSAGTWYIFDVAQSSAVDFAVQGTVSPVLTPIESWRLQYFGTTNNSGPSADGAIATSDGMPNLLKYALGLNPLVPSSNPVVGEISTGFLRLTLPKNSNATDVTFVVQVAPEVIGPWTSAGTVIDQNTPTLLQVHDNTPVPSADHRFIRPEVTRP